MDILNEGFEIIVRSRIGVDDTELPDNDIDALLVRRAEAEVKKRITEWASIKDESDLIYMENAAISYLCYLLVPSMARRVDLEVQTLDVKWKKEKVDWDKMSDRFIAEFEASLNSVTTAVVSSSLVTIANRLTRTRSPIGGTTS